MDAFDIEEKRRRHSGRFRSDGSSKSRFNYVVGASWILFFGILVLSLYGIFYRGSLTDLEVACEEDLCLTKECVTIASRILSYMDSSVDPCSSFYDHACGNYPKFRSGRYGEETYDVHNEAVDNIVVQIKKLFDDRRKVARSDSFAKAEMLFETCTNTTRRQETAMTDLRQFLSEIEISWPLVESDDSEPEGSWLHVVLQMEKYGFHTLFKPSFRVGQDKVTMDINCNLLVLPLSDYLDPASQSAAKHMKFYQNVVLLVLDLFDVKRREGKQMFQDIIELETRMAQVLNLQAAEEQIPLSEEHVEQLKSIWSRLLNRSPTEIDVRSVCLGDLDGAMALLNSAPKRLVLNYVGWRAAAHLLQFLGRRQQSLYNYYVNRLIDGEIVAPSAWRECSDLLRKEMGLVMAKALFEKGRFKKEQQKEIRKRFRDMKKAFVFLLHTIPWMDNQTATAFKDKLAKITLNFGAHNIFDEEIRQQIDVMFSELILEDRDSFFKNIMKVVTGVNAILVENAETSDGGSRFRSMSGLISDISSNTYCLLSTDLIERYLPLKHTPLGTDAHYSYTANSIEVELGLLVSPLLKYGHKMPRYLEYGQDVILAQEISHAFDITGLAYDGNGNYLGLDVLPPLVMQKFTDFVGCLTQQLAIPFSPDNPWEVNDAIGNLGSFYLTFAGLLRHMHTEQVDGNGTLPGIHLNKQQTYLIQASQMYCEARDEALFDLTMQRKKELKPRVNSAIANMVGIAQYFGCEPGTAMNPVHKCNLLM